MTLSQVGTVFHPYADWRQIQMKKETWLILIGAVAVGAIAQQLAKQEAAFLGLSAMELVLLGAAAGAVINRARTLS